MSESLLEAVKVHITGSDVALTPAVKDAAVGEVRTSWTTHLLPGTSLAVEHLRILAHAPNRKCASVTVVSITANAVAYLCASKADAQSLSGAVVTNTQVIVLHGTDEVFVSAPIGTAIQFGVVAEYQ